ncbi:sentrin-specific protease 1-like [Haemaphysalis longicornis]
MTDNVSSRGRRNQSHRRPRGALLPKERLTSAEKKFLYDKLLVEVFAKTQKCSTNCSRESCECRQSMERLGTNHAFDLNEAILNKGSPKWFKALEELLRIVEKECVFKRTPGESDADRRGFVPLELTPPMLAEVSAVLQPEPAGEVLSLGFRLNITRSKISTLNNGNWLNDEVINFYLNLIMERSATEDARENGWPRVYAFNTFFCPKLAACGYAAVKRWTHSVDLFSFDILLVPLHCTLHWCLAAVDFRKRSIAYYDSLVSKGNKWQYLFQLQDYLGDESQGKKSTAMEGDDWTLGNAEDLPKQENTSDRGVFMCPYSECLSRDAPVAFGQQHMPYFRKCMVYEILHKALLSA